MTAPLQNRPRNRLATRNAGTTVTVAVIVLLAVGLLAYSIGKHQQPDGSGSTASGQAHVGTQVASVQVGGWTYGFSTLPGSLLWYDTSGTAHDGGTAPCLAHPADSVPVIFGWVPATGPDGSSWRQVTWVRCGTS
jgi:hypothetical protein